MTRTKFGAYEILYELKSGGMGAVLLGRRKGPGAFEQLVAIKTIRPEYANTPAVRSMFLDEAAILARLNHPNIAAVHDFGEEGGTLYMVMEYVAGIPFRDVLELRLPPAIAARAIAEACRGVHAAHELRDLGGNLLGVVHRDISPDNLMLGYDGHIKVIDFGIALVKNRQAPVTEFGTVKGKPPYMSPEQVKNEAMDRRSDVFSLAAVLWELITGQALFDGDSIYAIARAVEHQAIALPSQVVGEALPLGLDAAVMNALDRDLAHRTPSAAALAEQLEQVIQTAGDETLEAWADRELAAPRAAHRAWLAGVVAGVDAPRPLGRPTGAVTALPDAPNLARAPTLIAPVAPAAVPTSEAPADPAASTHLDAVTDDGARVPRRRLALPIVLALAVLAAIAGIALMRGPRGAAVPRDAGPDTRDAHVAIVADAPWADAAPLDAAPPAPPPPALDAPPPDAPAHHHAIAHDAAVPLARPPDAAPAEAPKGTGFLTVKHRPGPFRNVVLDGTYVFDTPKLRAKIPAGRHRVQLLAPESKEVVYETTITVEDGQSATVQEP